MTDCEQEYAYGHWLSWASYFYGPQKRISFSCFNTASICRNYSTNDEIAIFHLHLHILVLKGPKRANIFCGQAAMLDGLKIKFGHRENMDPSHNG